MKTRGLPRTPPSIQCPPFAYLLLLATIIAAMTIGSLPATATPAPASSIASEVARLPGLQTFGEMLDRTRLGEMIERTDMTIVLFAFEDRAWEELVEAVDRSSGASFGEEELGELMRMHGVVIDAGLLPGENKTGEDLGKTWPQWQSSPRQHLERIRDFLLEREGVRTMTEGYLSVVEHARGAARVNEGHVLAEGRVSVLTIDRVIFPPALFERAFPGLEWERAPVSQRVFFGEEAY